MKSINQSNSIKRAVYLLLIIFMGTCGLILVNYYQNRINTNAINALQKDSLEVVQNKARTLESELQKFSLLPIALTDDRYVLEAIRPETTNSLKIDTLNVKLASLAQRTGAPYIFVVNNLGETIASSNYNQDDSFVGRKYEFRPYFKEAIRYGEAEYFAKGERTGKAGLFLARRIDDNQTSLGVIVVKVEFDATAQRWNENNSITFVTNSDGIILFSTDARLNYSTVKELDTKRRQEIIASKQFANEPLQKSPISITSSQNQTQISKLK